MPTTTRSISTIGTLRSAASLYACRPLAWLLLASPAYSTVVVDWAHTRLASSFPGQRDLITWSNAGAGLLLRLAGMYAGWMLLYLMAYEAIGVRRRIREAYRCVRQRLLNLLGLIFLSTFLGFVAASLVSPWFGTVGLVTSSSVAPAVVLTGIALIIVAFYLRFLFAFLELIHHDIAVFDALDRSWRRTKGNVGAMLGPLLLAQLLTVATVLLHVIAQRQSWPLADVMHWPSTLIAWLVTPWTMATIVQLWLDLGDGPRELTKAPIVDLEAVEAARNPEQRDPDRDPYGSASAEQER